jgi:hypothetical protein
MSTSVLPERADTDARRPSQHLRATMAAVRLCFTWFGVHRSLTPEQRAQAAESFGAEGKFLSAGKKLLDTKHSAFQAVTAIRGQILSYWKAMSLPYPEPGLRLIRRQDIEPFNEHLTVLRSSLAEAVQVLDEHYGELRAAARDRLGSLFNSGDYPLQLSGLFGISWEFPSVEPPTYLRDLNPALFEQEQTRVAARFDEAVRLAEEAFVGELERLVSHLTERLSGTEDGKPKIFRDSAIENLQKFFSRFRQLNVRSNEQLDELVAQAQRIVQGVAPQQLRDDQSLRQQVSTQLSGLQSVLDGLLVDRPRRAILRKPR